MLDPKNLKVGDRFWTANPAMFKRSVLEVEACYIRAIEPGLGPIAWGNGGCETSIPKSRYWQAGHRLPNFYETPEEAATAYFANMAQWLETKAAIAAEQLLKDRADLETMKATPVQIRDRGVDYEPCDL